MYAAIVAPALVACASIALSVGMALPAARPDHPATLLLLPGQQQTVLTGLTRLDPDLRLLSFRAGGLLLTVQYRRDDLPAKLTGLGILAIIGAGAIACHS